MYCPTCGVDSVEGLKYCKRCGANITATFSPPPKKFPLAFTIAFLIIIAGVFAIGLALPLAASHDLTASGFSTGQLMELFLAVMGVTLVVIVLLVWLFLRLIRLYHQTGSATPVTQSLPIEFEPQQIAGPPEPIGSVTENTTRSFGPRGSRQREE